MSTRNLEKIFSPAGIAVIGAGDDPKSVGGTIFRNLVDAGYGGPLFPVNPKREKVQGVKAYPAVADLPEKVDLAVIATPAATVPDLVGQCGRAGILGVVVTSAGFRESGREGEKLAREVLENARPHGVRVLGPNCLGIIMPRSRINASFTASPALPGPIAFLSQSGALCTAVVEWANLNRVGFSAFVSAGEMLDVDFGDLIDYFGSDAATQSIVLYAESVTNARKFISAARAFTLTKPIVAVKSGRFAESTRAIASHTGSLAGEDLVFEAAFHRAGIVRVDEIADLFSCAETLAKQKNPRGPRLAVVTNAGGPGILAADALMARGGVMAELSPPTLEALDAVLPAYWSHGNPVDLLGDAPPEFYGKALEAAAADGGVDGILAILTPQAMTDAKGSAAAVAEVAGGTEKPVLASWMGHGTVQEGWALLNEKGIPTFSTPEQAVRTFVSMHEYSRNLELLYETPKELDVELPVDAEELDRLVGQEGPGTLPEALSKRLLEKCGFPVVETHEARSAGEAVWIASRIGYPVVLKVLSPEISHKSDYGGVLLNIGSDDDVVRGFEKITTNVWARDPDILVEGVTVQKMIVEEGWEVILGAKRDPVFGSVLLFGTGGTAAEIFRDRAVALPPLNERLAMRLIESVKGYRLLKGIRERPPADLDALGKALIRLSYLIVHYPRIVEMDINPLLAGPGGVWVLDARIVVGERPPEKQVRTYDHLAIRPYPEHYRREEKLRDGTPVILRPIRPEDVPLWHDMIGAFSKETMRFRFFSGQREITRRMEMRYCFVDYEKEIALIAEHRDNGHRRLIGVARISLYPDMETGEFAVAVSDPWQGKGVGALLTDYALNIARNRGLREIRADALAENKKVINLMKQRGFDVRFASAGMVGASLVLSPGKENRP